MLHRSFVAMTLITCFALFGCTMRYSQVLVGAIPQSNGNEVRSSDSGFSLFGITVTEPRPAHEQVVSLMGACQRLTRVEIDYREIFFLFFGTPEVTVTGKCEP